MPPAKAVISWGQTIIAIIGFGKTVLIKKLAINELDKNKNTNFKMLAVKTPSQKFFFLKTPKHSTKTALPIIIYGIIGKSGIGKSPARLETMLGKNPIKTPAPIPNVAVETYKTALTIGPVINCCFKKGAAIDIAKKTAKTAIFIPILVLAKAIVLIILL